MKNSFNTKWELFLFDCVLNEKDANPNAFENFEISNELIDIHTTKYKQDYLDDRILKTDEREVDQIYHTIEKLRSELDEVKYLNLYRESFGKILSEEQYNKLIKNEKCFYCELEKKDFGELYENHLIRKKANRGFNFEIDRKNPNEEYHYDNLVMACYWCNNAKTDEFTAEEFKPIGEAIGAALMARINR
ncbi:hypothetical protein [Marivirga atlantica]|uniref:HNH domain-containing protein n=2 Tax=Marivirga atlantica TaxID=1548457 RepID=A0A937AG52_9BACT|nr:hypothetical protein [Marivirga atlantica]